MEAMENGVLIHVPQVAIPNTFRAIVKFIQFGTERLIDLYFRTDAGGSSHTAQGLAQVVLNQVAANFMQLFSDTMNFDSVKALDLRSVPYVEAEIAANPGQHGSKTDEAAAPADALRVAFSDGIVYKGGHGGVSLPGFVVTDFLNGLWSTATLALAHSVLNTIMVVGPDSTGNSWDLANIHHKINKVVVNTSSPVHALLAQPQTRTQRRRNVGKGSLTPNKPLQLKHNLPQAEVFGP